MENVLRSLITWNATCKHNGILAKIANKETRPRDDTAQSHTPATEGPKKLQIEFN